MSFLKDLKKQPKTEMFKQKEKSVKQKTESFKQETLKLNPNVKSIEDIPNTNIMTSGNLLGIRLRAKKSKMLEELQNYIGELLKNAK